MHKIDIIEEFAQTSSCTLLEFRDYLLLAYFLFHVITMSEKCPRCEKTVYAAEKMIVGSTSLSQLL